MGLDEASKLLGKRVEKGRLTPEKMAQALNAIRPTMSYGDFGNVDIVVEAVVENPKVKHAVLAEVEGHVREDAIIASTPPPSPSATWPRRSSVRKTSAACTSSTRCT